MSSFAIRLGLVAILLSLGTNVFSAERPPNIVFILADDLGYTDLGCMGATYYETPHIDRLAAQGMRLLNHHHCQNCTPTRAALMSGQYPPRTGVYSVGSLERGSAADRKLQVPTNVTNLPLDRQTLANQLQKAGYATGMFGKWHLGQRGDYHPARRGFEEAIVTIGRHFEFKTTPTVDVEKGVYLADFLTQRATDFIDRHRDKPFFLYLPHFGVHSPYEAKPELIAQFRNKAGRNGHDNPTYAAMIASIDESVGRVMAKLQELKLGENTLVIFASDNGGVGGYGDIRGKGVTANRPLRGGKGMLYEGGTRVPFIVRWPGVVPAGSESREPTTHVDLFPSLLEVANAPPPKQTLDGESLLTVWKKPSATLRRDAIYAHFPGYLEGYGTNQWRTTPVSTIHAGDWKLLEFLEDGRLELYNLEEDIGEKQNLASSEPDRARTLQAKLAQWRKDLNAQMPQPKSADDRSNDAPPRAKKKNKKRAA